MQQFKLNGKPHSVAELEKALFFSFLPSIDFDSPREKEEIYQSTKDVKSSELELGERYEYQIRNSWLAPVDVRWVSKNVGHGLFVTELLEEGSYVGEYTGIVRNNRWSYSDPLGVFGCEYPVNDPTGQSYVINATQGHLTRFINHSEEPNLEPHYAFCDGFYHVIFMTLREIRAGEQLSFDYGPSYWSIRPEPEPIG